MQLLRRWCKRPSAGELERARKSASTKTPSEPCGRRIQLLAVAIQVWQSAFCWQFACDVWRNSPSTSIESRSCSDIMLLALSENIIPNSCPCQEGVWLHRTTASHQHADYADDAAASECASRHLAVAVQGSAAKGAGFQAALRHTTKAPVRPISWLQAGSPEMLDFKPQAGLQQREHGRNQQARRRP